MTKSGAGNLSQSSRREARRWETTRELCPNPSSPRPVEYRDIQTHVEQGGANLLKAASSHPVIVALAPVGRIEGGEEDVTSGCENAARTTKTAHLFEFGGELR